MLENPKDYISHCLNIMELHWPYVCDKNVFLQNCLETKNNHILQSQSSLMGMNHNSSWSNGLPEEIYTKCRLKTMARLQAADSSSSVMCTFGINIDRPRRRMV